MLIASLDTILLKVLIDYNIVLFGSVVIGQSDYYGLGFITLKKNCSNISDEVNLLSVKKIFSVGGSYSQLSTSDHFS